MNCETIRNSELGQRYVLGELTEAEQESYERHYFECELCFEQLRTLQALQSVLRSEHQPRTNYMPGWRRGAIAAAILLTCLVGWQIARFARGRSQLPTTAVYQPVNKPAGVPIQGSADRNDAELQQLAQVKPPLYRAPVLRGAGQTGTERFRTAMQAYQRQDYTAAAAGLTEAYRLNPAAPAPAFYLGVCYLIQDQVSQAGVLFNKTIAMGNTPYLELAHFYMAKTFLRGRDASSAHQELQATVTLRGDKQMEAQALLDRLDAIQSKR